MCGEIEWEWSRERIRKVELGRVRSWFGNFGSRWPVRGVVELTKVGELLCPCVYRLLVRGFPEEGK